jgi:hypothetical protein
MAMDGEFWPLLAAHQQIDLLFAKRQVQLG